MVDPDRLSAAFQTARCDLLAESAAPGHWVGRQASSPLATATAVSALSLFERHAPTVGGRLANEKRECALSELVMASLRWLAKHQNADGGWGDREQSPSTIATTLLVRSAFALTCVPADHPGLLERADAYIKAQGGLRALKRHYSHDKTFAALVLANGALAGLVPWRKVPALPFEWTCFPPRAWKLWRLPNIGRAMPARLAVGQARFVHRKPWNPITRALRGFAFKSSLQVLETLQPATGGAAQAVPLTSFVVMSLASIGLIDLPATRNGAESLLLSVRGDGSWPSAANRAIWNTTLATIALAAAGENISELGCLDRLLAGQHRHPQRDAAPGRGWSCTDLPGGVPDADATSGALLALAAWSKADPADRLDEIRAAAAAGVEWLLESQNADGGWPSLGHAAGGVFFDRSGADLTAHALRALNAWRSRLSADARAATGARIDAAIPRGVRFLYATQHADGYWTPWRPSDGHRADEANPIYGTVRVLAALRELSRLNSHQAHRALEWLMTMKRADGSFAGPVGGDGQSAPCVASVEETALAAEALLTCGQTKAHDAAALQAIEWLVDAVEANRHQETSPGGSCLAKLRCHDGLDPLILTVSALGQAVRRLLPQPAPHSATHSANR